MEWTLANLRRIAVIAIEEVEEEDERVDESDHDQNRRDGKRYRNSRRRQRRRRQQQRHRRRYHPIDVGILRRVVLILQEMEKTTTTTTTITTPSFSCVCIVDELSDFLELCGTAVCEKDADDVVIEGDNNHRRPPPPNGGLIKITNREKSFVQLITNIVNPNDVLTVLSRWSKTNLLSSSSSLGYCAHRNTSDDSGGMEELLYPSLRTSLMRGARNGIVVDDTDAVKIIGGVNCVGSKGKGGRGGGDISGALVRIQMLRARYAATNAAVDSLRDGRRRMGGGEGRRGQILFDIGGGGGRIHNNSSSILMRQHGATTMVAGGGVMMTERSIWQDLLRGSVVIDK